MLMDLNGDRDWEDDGEWVLQNMETEDHIWTSDVPMGY